VERDKIGLIKGFIHENTINMFLREARANTSKNIYYVYRHALKMFTHLATAELGEVWFFGPGDDEEQNH
jgi:hypothetical protein